MLMLGGISAFTVQAPVFSQFPLLFRYTFHFILMSNKWHFNKNVNKRTEGHSAVYSIK